MKKLLYVLSGLAVFAFAAAQIAPPPTRAEEDWRLYTVRQIESKKSPDAFGFVCDEGTNPDGSIDPCNDVSWYRPHPVYIQRRYTWRNVALQGPPVIITWN